MPHSKLWERDGHDNNWLVRLPRRRAAAGRFPHLAWPHFAYQSYRLPTCCMSALLALLLQSLQAPTPSPLQLLEFVLAIPFAVGFKTSAVARALAATLAAEAVTCWPFWADWPTRTYAGHVR